MRAFNILVIVLSGYLTVLGVKFFNPQLDLLLFQYPIDQYERTVLREQERTQKYNSTFYHLIRSDAVGVSINDEKSYGEYTFFKVVDDLSPKLMDKEGNVVYEWYKDPREIWTDPSAKIHNMNVKNLFSNRAFLDPEDGSVYLFISTRGYEDGHYAIVKLDKNSELLWKHDNSVHHDLAFSNDKQELYVLIRPQRHKEHTAFPRLKPPYWEEAILVLDKEGNPKKEISFMDLFAKSSYHFVIDKLTPQPQDPFLPYGDLFHSNTIEVVPPEADGKAPMLKEGHLMISFRNLDLLIMVDPEKEEITWASYGPWKGQHDPEIQADGTFIMFDNLGSFDPDSAGSRLIQVDFNTMEIVWEYNGTKKDPFFSAYNSAIHVLPNGNILATESNSGRLIEVTKDKEIVWEYWNPNRAIIEKSRYGLEHDNTEHIAALFSAVRYGKDDVPFLSDNSGNSRKK